VLFCTVTALGLVRLVSQAKVMGAAVNRARDASAPTPTWQRWPSAMAGGLWALIATSSASLASNDSFWPDAALEQGVPLIHQVEIHHATW